ELYPRADATARWFAVLVNAVRNAVKRPYAHIHGCAHTRAGEVILTRRHRQRPGESVCFSFWIRFLLLFLDAFRGVSCVSSRSGEQVCSCETYYKSTSTANLATL
uniref:Uncharacterized protein n=1 Tax=Anopheles dirus TaxID=7168 RepID=A0A182NYJ8_9DIPT